MGSAHPNGVVSGVPLQASITQCKGISAIQGPWGLAARNSSVGSGVHGALTGEAAAQVAVPAGQIQHQTSH